MLISFVAIVYAVATATDARTADSLASAIARVVHLAYLPVSPGGLYLLPLWSGRSVGVPAWVLCYGLGFGIFDVVGMVHRGLCCAFDARRVASPSASSEVI